MSPAGRNNSYAGVDSDDYSVPVNSDNVASATFDPDPVYASANGNASSKEHIYESLSELRREKAKLRKKKSGGGGRFKRLSLDVTKLVARVTRSHNNDEEAERRPVISSPVSVTRRSGNKIPTFVFQPDESFDSVGSTVTEVKHSVSLPPMEVISPPPQPQEEATSLTFTPTKLVTPVTRRFTEEQVRLRKNLYRRSVSLPQQQQQQQPPSLD